MGRSSWDSKNALGELFSQDEISSRERPSAFLLTTGRSLATTPRPPEQTNSKSKLVAEYIASYQRITHGGLFIDGFAGPQSKEHLDAWTARRVLEIQPPRIRRFWLCELDPAGLIQLRRLKDAHHLRPSSRKISVMPGNFNRTVDTILLTGRIRPKTPTFAFLDQRTMECEWATVRKLATFRSRRKIEIMYFLGTGWLHRAMASRRDPKRIAECDRWWGGPTWRGLLGLRHDELVQRVVDRFQDELGYGYVKAYPIHLRESGKKVAFHLIHASDHEQAPVLMTRAYLKICGDIQNTPSDSQGDWVQAFGNAH
ncbi:three-Cys-motif partner protein TcmP [Gemmobacter lutimaris]|uniref:Three-Cys-motif partner protein TcmP n=1 Tax=Gemmobacter lutimaris TaxID=2306023 RepID=A0A398BIZ2_9RHOB|nr:three-Cys-motif partner protein TcmP [Gemmobacter lutimaris]RID89624.1 three-Cys-motif partner protein TcmP [Gemmobacter lutimaris]